MAKKAPNKMYWVRLHLPDGMEIRRRPVDAVELLRGGEARIRRNEFAKLGRKTTDIGGKFKKRQIIAEGEAIQPLPGAEPSRVPEGPQVDESAFEEDEDDEDEEDEAPQEKSVQRSPFKGKPRIGAVSPLPAGENPPPEAVTQNDPEARKIGGVFQAKQ